jgi:hypothetical protein
VSKKKDIRAKFRNSVLERDGNGCRWCGIEGGAVVDIGDGDPKTVFLSAHHITDRNEMPNGGYVKENGITLCDDNDGYSGCHMKAELFHISEGTECTPNMHPNDLYELIGSSKELAIEKSKRL